MPQLKSRTDRGLISWRRSGGTRGPVTINEAIALGVTAGPALTATAQAAASLALGVAATMNPAAQTEPGSPIALGVTSDTSFTPTAQEQALIALGVGVGIVFDEDVHLGQVRRGKTAVVVTGKSSAAVTVTGGKR